MSSGVLILRNRPFCGAGGPKTVGVRDSARARAAETRFQGLHVPRLQLALGRGVHLQRRHVDADGRAELARADDHGEAVVPRVGRRAAGLAVPRLLALRRRPRRPDRPAPDPPRLAGRPALVGLPPRGPRLHEPDRGLDDPRPVLRRRARAVLRRPGLPGARPDARRPGGPPERRRAELDPVQPGAGHRPGPRAAARSTSSARPPASA